MIKSEFDQSSFLPFSNLIVDTNDLIRTLNELASVSRSFFKNREGTISEKSRDFLASDLVNVFAQVEKTGMVPIGDSKQQEFVTDLIAYLRDLPIVKLTLAFGPTTTFITRINQQISQMVGRKIVLDVLINKKIMGGVIFEYKGRVKQETLDEKLTKTVTELVSKQMAKKGVSSSQ